MSSKQYGKRAKEDYEQLTVQIPKKLKKALRIAIAEEDTDFSAYVEEAIREKLAMDKDKKK